MTDDVRPRASLEDLLTSAVDRQVGEQRAIAEAMQQLSETVQAMRTEIAEGDPVGRVLVVLEQRLDGLEDGVERRIAGALAPHTDATTRVRGSVVDLRSQISEGVDGLRDEISGMRAHVGAAIAGLGEELRSARVGAEPVTSEAIAKVDERLSSVGDDVHGVAEALLGFSRGLRDWADDVETKLGSLTEALTEGLGDLSRAQSDQSRTQRELMLGIEPAVGQQLDRVGPVMEALADRVKTLTDRFKETSDVSRYQQDQIEDVDRLIAKLGELPDKLEGVVAQAMRRANTVRAGLAQETERALESALEPITERLGVLLDEAEDGAPSDRSASENMRKVALQQIELANRIDDVQEAFLEALADAERARRQRDRRLMTVLESLGANDEEVDDLVEPDEPDDVDADVEDEPDEEPDDEEEHFDDTDDLDELHFEPEEPARARRVAPVKRKPKPTARPKPKPRPKPKRTTKASSAARRSSSTRSTKSTTRKPARKSARRKTTAAKSGGRKKATTSAKKRSPGGRKQNYIPV